MIVISRESMGLLMFERTHKHIPLRYIEPYVKGVFFFVSTAALCDEVPILK